MYFVTKLEDRQSFTENWVLNYCNFANSYSYNILLDLILKG